MAGQTRKPKTRTRQATNQPTKHKQQETNNKKPTKCPATSTQGLHPSEVKAKGETDLTRFSTSSPGHSYPIATIATPQWRFQHHRVQCSIQQLAQGSVTGRRSHLMQRWRSWASRGPHLWVEHMWHHESQTGNKGGRPVGPLWRSRCSHGKQMWSSWVLATSQALFLQYRHMSSQTGARAKILTDSVAFPERQDAPCAASSAVFDRAPSSPSYISYEVR